LEDGVEVQELDTRHVIHLFLRDHVLQIVVHRIECDRIAIGARVPQDGTVITDEDEVNTPGVNTDTGDLQPPAGHLLQALDDFEIKCVDLPVEMSTLFYKVIGEARHLLQVKLTVVDTANDSSATCGT